MDKEIIELLKQIVGSGETLVIWYMVIDFVKHCISWAGAIACLYWCGRGASAIGRAIKDY